jgi:hypothetical protein
VLVLSGSPYRYGIRLNGSRTIDSRTETLSRRVDILQWSRWPEVRLARLPSSVGRSGVAAAGQNVPYKTQPRKQPITGLYGSLCIPCSVLGAVNEHCAPAEEPTKQTSMSREWCTQAHTASTSLISCAPVNVLRPVLEPTPRMSKVTTGSPLSAMRTAIPRMRALQPPNFEYWCTRTTAHARFNRTCGSILHHEDAHRNVAKW